MSYVWTYDQDYGDKGESRIESEEAHIAIDILALEVVIVVIAGGLLYWLSSGSDDEEEVLNKP